jgi:DNA polymerase-3 subunit alpha
MESISTYNANKRNPDKVKYIHPKLEPILHMTYGCIVYQEQVMQIVRDIAGYSMGQSDILRRAMSKKQADVMAANEAIFIDGQLDEDGNVVIDGAVRRGVDAASAKKIFDQMKAFAQYAFNKSHAAAYAVIAYQTGYLKALYPVEYMAALLSAAKDSEGKVEQYINDCKERNVDVLPPDLNESYRGFTAVGEKIRFGLGAVKHVGDGVVDEIIAERQKKGLFKSFYDFADRMGTVVNKKAVEYLIMAGAFDFGDADSRATLYKGYERVLSGAASRNKNNLSGQFSLFGAQGIDVEEYAKMEPVAPWDSRTRIQYEKEAAGIYMSGHPLDTYRQQLKESVTVDSAMLADEEYGPYHDGQFACIGGIITEIRAIVNKRGDPMAFMTIEDTLGKVDIVVFTDVYRKKAGLLKKDSIVLVKGRINAKENQAAGIVAQEVIPLEESAQSAMLDSRADEMSLLIKIEYDKFNEYKDDITEILKRYSGENQVYLHFYDIRKKLKADKGLYVKMTDDLVDEINALAGEGTAAWI